MGISGLIKQQKSKFFAARDKFSRARIVAETERLERERRSEAERAKLNAAKQRAARDLQKIKGYNQKVQGSSKVQKFGKGLAKVINQGRAQLQEQKQKTGGINFGAASSPFGGSSGKRSGPFALGTTKPEKKNKGKRITITIKE